MKEPPPRWQDLQEESLRPAPAERRMDLRVLWVEWPGGHKRRVGLRGLTNEALDWLVRETLAELAMREEGRLAAARLLAKYGGE